MKTLKWILENFGVVIVYQVMNHFFDFKIAIISTLIFAVIELIVLKLNKRPISIFMLFSFALVFVFGAFDLYLENQVFFKFESAIISLITAMYFGISLFKDKSIVEEFAEQQGRVTTEKTPDKTFFFKFITACWFVYFIGKSIIYAWIAQNNSTEANVIYRTVFGTASFYILLALSIAFSQQIWNLLLKAKLMPSTRTKKRASAERKPGDVGI